VVYHNPYSIYLDSKIPYIPLNNPVVWFIAQLRPWPQPHQSQILRSPTGAELCRGIGLVFQDFWLIVTCVLQEWIASVLKREKSWEFVAPRVEKYV